MAQAYAEPRTQQPGEQIYSKGCAAFLPVPVQQGELLLKSTAHGIDSSTNRRMSGVDACFGLFLITWSFLTGEASAPVVVAVLPAPRRLLSALFASGAVSIGDWCAGNLTAFALATERFAIAGPSVRLVGSGVMSSPGSFPNFLPPRTVLALLLASGAVSSGGWYAGNLSAFALATERFTIKGFFRPYGWLRGGEFAWFIPKFLVTSNGACLAACLRRRF